MNAERRPMEGIQEDKKRGYPPAKNGRSPHWKNEFAKTQNNRDFWNLVKKVKTQECKQNTIGPIKDNQGNIVLMDSVKATLMNDYF